MGTETIRDRDRWRWRTEDAQGRGLMGREDPQGQGPVGTQSLKNGDRDNQGPSGTGTINHHKQRLDTTGDKDAPNHWGQMPPGRGDTSQPCSLPAAMEGFQLGAGGHTPAALGSPWDRATLPLRVTLECP